MSLSWDAVNFQSQKLDLSPKTLVFIDGNLENAQLLASGAFDGVEVRILDPNGNGIEQVTTELQNYAEIHGSLDAVQIFSHGNSGQLQLGSVTLSSQNLDQYQSQLQQWKSLLSENADFLIYGCNVAAGEGLDFVQQLSELTGADVAASTDLTGSTALGGDWDLEVNTGEIEATSALRPEVMAGYNGVLQSFVVTTTADSGAGSLRDAIAAAQSGDTIVFDASLAGRTITLSSGQLAIPAGKNLIIDGANAPGLTISGNNSSRVFFVNANVDFRTNFTIKNLTIANGYTPERGGGIGTPDEATLLVENVQFNNNVANKGGGAIYMDWNSTLSVIGSKFNGNKATAANDERGAGAIAFVSPKAFSVRDSEFTNNLGINGGAINSLRGKLTIENSTFINNNTTAAFFDTGKTNDFLRGYGGAIYTDRASNPDDPAGGTIRISNSTFQGNKGRAEGGAAYLFTGTNDNVILESSTFENNEILPLPNGNAGNGGALVQISNGANRGFTITNTTFANNKASNQGGGVWIYDAPTKITNSTFFGNRAEATDFNGNGGAIALYANADIVNTTIANNYAGWVGGGISAQDGRTVTVKNTIFANNTAANLYQIGQETSRVLTDLGGNIQATPKLTNFGNDNNATATITIANPLLGLLQNINGSLVLPLLPGSAAIDTGTGSGSPTTDQRGVTRPIDGDGNGSAIVDSGAYEFNGIPVITPEIQVLNNTTNIADGTTIAINFGTTTVGAPLIKTFTINNLGIADLNLSNLQLPTGFSVVGNLPDTVAPLGQTSLQIQLDATAVGNLTGELSFATNDADENLFNFAIAGNVNPGVPGPEIQVLDNATNIADGNATPINFGNTTVGTSLTKNFTIKNLGTTDLNLSNLQLPTGFSVVGNLPGIVAPAQQASLQITLDAAVVGNLTGELSFTTNDSDENPFNFAIAGNVNPVATPEIQVLDGSTDILDGTTTAINFGTTPIGTPVTKNFTIKNLGAADLNLSNLQLPTGFSVVGNLPGIVAPAQQASLQIQLDATAVDNLTGELSFTTNDSDENPFNFAIAGAINTIPINTILGTGGRDSLTGTSGSDRIIGSQVGDTLTGGLGNDEFVYNSVQDSGDFIMDFQVGSDKIVMTNLLASLGYNGSNPIADGYVSFSNRLSDTIMLLDPDGAGTAAIARAFVVLKNMSAANLNSPDNFVFS